MTPEELQQWIAGAASREGPDAGGNMTYLAADGNYIVVRPNGTLAMRGFRPPDGAAQAQPSTPAAPAQPSTGVGPATQQQLEARIAQLPGLVYQGQSMKTKPSPIQGLPDKQVPTVTWINPTTGQTLVAEVGEGGGAYTIVTDGVVASNRRSTPSDERPQTVPTNTTEPHIVTRNPDGSLTTTPNPNYKPPDPQKPSYITAQDGTIYEVQPGKPPKAIIQGAKPGSTVAVNGGKTLLYVGQDGTTKIVWQSENVNEDAQYNPSTQQYEVVTKDANGRVTGVRAVPISGQGQRKPGPALPTMVVGMSSDALRQYGDQLSAAVAAGDMTPAERDKRWGEALQFAQHAVNEATVTQRQQESNLNARVNLATTRYSNEMDGLNNALSFVSKLNGQLPEGSPLGGQALAALLGMQAIARKRSGIDAIEVPGVSMRSAQAQQIDNAATNATATTSAQISRLTNPANPQAVAADRAAVAAQLAAEQAQAAQPPAVAPTMPSRPAAPAAPASAAPVLPPNRPDQMQAAPQIESAISPPAVSSPPLASPIPSDMPPGYVPTMGSAPPPPPVSPPFMGDASATPISTNMPPNYATPADMQPGTMVQVPGEAPGVAVPYPSDAGTVSMAPGEDFAILAQQQAPPPSVQAPPDMIDHPAILADEASRIPPWRMTPDQIERYRMAGIPDEIITGVPSFGSAA